MNKSLIGGLAVLIVLVLVGFIVLGDSKDDDNANTSETTTNQTTETTNNNAGEEQDAAEMVNENSQEPGSTTITMAEVAMHATEDDCWTYINAKVYDLTSYIPRHPGGDEILRACGADGTRLFFSRTTSSGEEVGSGTPHSGNAAAQLEDLYLGELTN